MSLTLEESELDINCLDVDVLMIINSCDTIKIIFTSPNIMCLFVSLLIPVAVHVHMHLHLHLQSN